jgi:peptide/nickel transport system substrate-binding protein
MLYTIGDPKYWRVNHAVRFQEEQWGYTDVASKYFPNDMELAKTLVAQSDYNGEPIRILASPGRQPEFKTTVVLLELLTDLGLNARIETVDVATFVQKRAQMDQWEIKPTGGGPGGPISLMFSIRDRTGTEWPGVAPEWHIYMDQIIISADREVRTNAIFHLNRLHSEACHEMWYGDVFEVVGSRSYVKNVPTWPGPAMWNIWLDK